MHTWFPYEKRNHYPHMKPADVLIWERFLDTHPNKYKKVLYDFCCGESRPGLPEMTDNLNEDWRVLGQKKIDVIADAEDHFDVIEVKPRAGLGALGQALAYKWLYESDEIPDRRCVPVIVTDELMPDMQRVADAHGVRIFVV